MRKRNTRMANRRRPLEYIDPLKASSPFPESELTRILIKVHDAFAQLRAGTADEDHYDRMAAIINVGMIRAESIGQPGIDIFTNAKFALMECDALYGRHGKYGFTGTGLNHMKDAIALYEEILRHSTPLQMARAQEESIRRIRAGQVHRVTSTTTEGARA